MKLNIVIALPCEAKFIIQTLNLKKDVAEHTFEIYHNQDKTLCLIVSGIGKINAAIATTYIAQYANVKQQGFINIGIAAGPYEIGIMFLAHKLYDPIINKTFYPKINFLKNYPSRSLETIEIPNSDYLMEKMIDMEAYGFYQAAIKFTTQEFIQVIKIISDNSTETRQKISTEFVNQLMKKNINDILNVINSSHELLDKETIRLAQSKYFVELVQSFHFSQQQKLQLARLLQRAEIFLNETQINTIIKNANSSKSLLVTLNNDLGNIWS